MRLGPIVSTICLFPVFGTAFGEESSDVSTITEEVIVVETRLRDDSFAAGESVSIDAEELARVQPVDPEQLFQRLPGFSVSRPGGPGGVTEIFLRGAESNFTAIMIDGVRVNNPTNTRGGSFDFSLLGMQGIRRIDVATGAMSAIYGADAMAGVIHIHSAWPDAGSRELFAEAGTAGDWRAGAAATFGLSQDTEWNLRAAKTDGGHDVDGSHLQRHSIASRLTGNWASGGPWAIHVRRVKRERRSFPEVSGGPRFAVSPELERADGEEVSISGNSSWAVTDTWDIVAHASAITVRDESAVPAVPPGVLDGQPAFTSDAEYRRGELLLVNHVALDDSHQLVAGANFVTEDGQDDGTVNTGFASLPNSYALDRKVASLFAELGTDWRAGWKTAIALRWDDYNDDRRLSAKLGISKQTSSSGSRAWGRVGNGFKLPSFFASGNPLFGNPELVAEKARSAEVGYTHVWDNDNELVISAFTADFDDLVDFDFETFTNVNRGRIETDGFEVRARLDLTDDLQLRIDGNWSSISGGSEPMRRRPETTGGASLQWSVNDRWHIDAVARYVGSRLMTSIPTGDLVDGAYTIFGGTVTFRSSDGHLLWLAIDNAFDTSYQDAPGFPSERASARFGIKLTF